MPDDQSWIPKEGCWTFQNADVARKFDGHVREQLPWYDFTTSCVAHMARCYVPKGGLVYDVGASTGNIGNAMRETLEARGCRFFAVEQSKEMASQYKGPPELVIEDAMVYDFQPFDFAVCFLLFMFLPIAHRGVFAQKLVRLIRPGGALVIVDKINTPPGYCGTVMRRMVMSWKLSAGAAPTEIVAKELSLSGSQRPVHESLFGPNAVRWFQAGEFAGWIIERDELGVYSLSEVERRRSEIAALPQC